MNWIPLLRRAAEPCGSHYCSHSGFERKTIQLGSSHLMAFNAATTASPDPTLPVPVRGRGFAKHCHTLLTHIRMC